MRRERTDKDKLYLKCRRTKWSATHSILIKDVITTEKSSGTRYVSTPDVTEEILNITEFMNNEYYDIVFHGQCRSTKHEPDCNKNAHQQKSY